MAKSYSLPQNDCRDKQQMSSTVQQFHPVLSLLVTSWLSYQLFQYDEKISSHFCGASLRPNGAAVGAKKSIMSCNPSGDMVNIIWSSAYSIDDRWNWINLTPVKVKRNDQLTNERAIVKKLGEAGHPWRTPRNKLNAVPETFSMHARTLEVGVKWTYTQK